MTPEIEALARRVVACPAWRWMPGMSTQGGCRVLRRDPDGYTVGYHTKNGYVMQVQGDTLPDLSDPATIGCLLALAREAYGDPSLYVRRGSTRRESDGIIAWEVLGWLNPERSPDGRAGSWRGWGYASEAEALVAALEGAP